MVCSQGFLIRFDEPKGTWSYHKVTIPVVYSQQMVAESGHSVSPSASKPAKVAEALRQRDFPVDFFPPDSASREDFLRVHDPQFVNGVFDGRVDNGFGNRSMEIARSLPYTSGSMITAAKLVLSKRKSRPVVAALCSGFHHATWNEAEGFCTFNGLMVAAAHLLHHGDVTRIAIIDADYHYGNGTDDILDRTGLRANVFHFSFGKEFKRPDQAADYLNRMRGLEPELARFEPQVILYQAGADPHIEDPLGGCLTTEQMANRDELMFGMAVRNQWPIVFNLAGGYQKDADGGISQVVQLHLNTFSAALRIIMADSSVSQG